MSFSKFHGEHGNWDISISKWKSMEGSGDHHLAPKGNFIRHFKYKQKVNAPIGPPQTRLHKLQRYQYDDNCMNLWTVANTPDVPFGSLFHVRDFWTASANGEGMDLKVDIG